MRTPSPSLARTAAFLCLASLSAAVLPGRAAAEDASPSVASADQDYAQAVEFFRQYSESKTGLKNDGNKPFLLTHGRKTAKSVLMVHGYTDSPYYMRALADVFYAEGYNVVAILLPGHGTKPEDLLRINLRQWEEETRFGFNLAGQLGDEVSLAGFSTGGGLVLEALAENETSYSPRPIGGIFLFSPAIKIGGDLIKDLELDLTCTNSDIVTLFKPWWGDSHAPEQLYRYSKMAINGICQVYDLTLEDRRRRAEISSAIGKGVGVFVAQSEADRTVDPTAVEKFMSSLPAGTKSDFILYPKSAGIAHADVPRPETNPFYGELAARLRTFLAPPMSGPTLNALSSSLAGLDAWR